MNRLVGISLFLFGFALIPIGRILVQAPGRAGTYQTPSADTAASCDAIGRSTEHRSPRLTEKQLAMADLHPTLAQHYPDLTEKPDWPSFIRKAQTITVAPYPGVPLAFQRLEIKDGKNHVTWYGTNPSVPGSSLIAVASPRGGFDSILIVPGANQFAFHTDPDGRTFVEETTPHNEGCAVYPAVPDRNAPALGLEIQLIDTNYNVNVPAPEIVKENLILALAAETPKVDVLFIYDADTLADAQSKSSDAQGYIEGQIRARIESANKVLANSQITAFQWNVVGVQLEPAGIAKSAVLEDYLKAMASNSSLSNQRITLGADQVVFLKGSSEGNYSGLANMGPHNATYSVIRWNTSYKTLAHELAHNFGCNHDRETAKAAKGDGLYNYGQLFKAVSGATVPSGVTGPSCSTVMGYGDASIPFFSNPTITVHVNGNLAELSGTTLDWGTQALGYPVGNADAAYNAKILSDNAAAISAAYSAQNSPPAISGQPTSTTVNQGSSFSLSVTATGYSLTYQWYKDDTAIAGASQSVYTKTGASTADSGSYHVVVTNSYGTVKSNAATVTINTVSTQTPAPSSGGGGGGGGGGSPSLWFLGALALLALLRSRFRADLHQQGIDGATASPSGTERAAPVLNGGPP